MRLFSWDRFRRTNEKPVTVAVTRDSVAMSDDIDAPHARTFSFPETTPILDVITEIVTAGYLASIAGGKATWSVASNFPLAIVAQQWLVPRPFPERDFPISALRDAQGVVPLHFTYHVQRDPEIVYEEMARAEQKRLAGASIMLVDIWRRIIIGVDKSWVLFQHGTCVILTQPEPDPAAQAVKIMREWGPVHAGSPSADFSTTTLSDYPGWIVTGHHPDMLNYVSPDEVEGTQTGDLIVGLLGRAKRAADGADPQVVHVEDARGKGTTAR